MICSLEESERARLPARTHQHRPESHAPGVLFLVNSLAMGGSERKTVRLANALAAGNRDVAVAYLGPPESLLPEVHPTVAALNLRRRGKFSITALLRLTTIVRERNINTLIAVNPYSALYAVLARWLCKRGQLWVIVSVNTTESVTLKERLQMIDATLPSLKRSSSRSKAIAWPISMRVKALRSSSNTATRPRRISGAM